MANTGFHGEKVTMAALTGAMRDGVKAGDLIAKIHSALYFGKGADIGLTMAPVPFLASEAPGLIAGLTRHADAEPCEKPWTEEHARNVLRMALSRFAEAADFMNLVLSSMNGRSDPPDLSVAYEVAGEAFWDDLNTLKGHADAFPFLTDGPQDIDPKAPGYAADASPSYPVGNSETV